MEKQRLLEFWRAEEAAAHIRGWDFSHIAGRFEEEADLPWDYRAFVQSCRKDTDLLLDMDTGGGEFLRSLGHTASRTSATEGYPPNAALCEKVLLPLGIDFRVARGEAAMPFPDEAFTLILNRHGSYAPAELYRLLRPDGLFITEQVGEDNDRELVDLLLPGTPKPFPGLNLAAQARRFREAGFTILRGEEAFRPIRFFDVGALVWFARIIAWEFPGFSVDRCLERLFLAQQIAERDGAVQGTIHRYLLVARK